MKMFVRSFGTNANGTKSTHEYTERRECARIYDKMNADVNCDLLKGRSPNVITPEDGVQRLVFENYQVEEVAEGQFVIVFESRTEPEHAAHRA